jgi:hypothetical protein
MNRRWFQRGMIALCAWAVGVTASAPASAQSIAQLFPTKAGSTWQFTGSIRAGNQNQPLNLGAKIASVNTAGGRTTVVIEWTANGSVAQSETYIVTGSEVQRSRSGQGGSGVINPPVPVLRTPIRIGNAWNWKGTITTGGQTLNGTANLKIAARERLKTPAGALDAFRVDMTLTISLQGQNQKTTNSYWFAPGVGLVKQSTGLTGPGGQKITVEASVSKYNTK